MHIPKRKTTKRKAKEIRTMKESTRIQIDNQPHVRPDGGPVRDRPLCRGRRPAVPGSTSRLPCIVGRAFTPAGEVGGGGRALAGRLSAAGLQSLAAMQKSYAKKAL